MKKKIFGSLSILLFTLLLGFSSTSYATSFTDSELKNIFYNSLTNFGTLNNKEDVKSILDGISFSSWADYSIEYEYTFIACPILTADANTSIYMFYDNVNNKKSMYNYIHYTRYVRASYNKNTKTISFATDYAPNAPTYLQQNGFSTDSWRFNDLNFYTNTSSDTITLASGWHPSDIDEGVYNDIIWQFDYPAGYKYTIKNTTDWEYQGITQGFQINVGSVTDSQYIDNIQYRYGSWNGSQYVWSTYRTMYDYRKNGLINNYFSGSTTNNNGVLTTTLYLDTYNNGNNILEIKVSPDNTDLTTLYHYYYVLNNSTSVTGTVIDPGYTFSGDYQQEYNQQQQTNNITGSVEDSTDKVVETITDDSQVNNILDNTLSGDKIIQDIGFNFVVNPFEDIIKNTLIGFTNALLGSGNETINFSIYNHNYAIHSEDFSLPNGTLKSFISLLCNAFVVYNICKYGFKLYEWINTGRIQNLVNEQNRHQYYLF